MSLSIKNKTIQIAIKIYLQLIIGFYPLALMYKDSYQVIPIKLEGILYSVFLAVILNIGLFLTLSEVSLRWKKMTLFALFGSAISSCLIFYLPEHSPIAALTVEEWVHVRFIPSFLSLGFVIYIMYLVGIHKK